MRISTLCCLAFVSLVLIAPHAFGEEADLAVRFAVAIEDGDAETIRELLASGAAADSHLGEDGETPLMKAAWNGQEEIARILIDAGAEVNAATSDTGETALMNAVTRGSMPVVELLITAGADVKPRNTYGFDAFSSAVAAGRIDMAARMLKAKADIEAPVHGLTPIMFANTNEEMMRFLVDNGANVNAGVRTGIQTPLNLASMTGNSAAVKILIELKADVNGASKDGTTPLKAAQDAGHGEIVKILKAAGAKK